jgi:hypothetical protein
MSAAASAPSLPGPNAVTRETCGGACGAPTPHTILVVFTEIVTTNLAETQRVTEASHLYTDPPAGLLAAITWRTRDDEVSTLLVWQTPDARGPWSAERMMPLLEGELADVHSKPERVELLNLHLGPAGV